jgi:hypothetical protein
MGPSVTGKNRIPRRRSSRSQSRKCPPRRSAIVRRPLGRLSGASMGTRSGRVCRTSFSMSSSLNATRVCALNPRRKHRPVGRRGEPARSIPRTTNGLRFAVYPPRFRPLVRVPARPGPTWRGWPPPRSCSAEKPAACDPVIWRSGRRHREGKTLSSPCCKTPRSAGSGSL